MLCGFVGGRAAGRSCTRLAGVEYDDVWYTWWAVGWVQLGLGAVEVFLGGVYGLGADGVVAYLVVVPTLHGFVLFLVLGSLTAFVVVSRLSFIMIWVYPNEQLTYQTRRGCSGSSASSETSSSWPGRGDAPPLTGHPAVAEGAGRPSPLVDGVVF